MRQNSGTCLNICVMVLVRVGLRGLDDGRNSAAIMRWRTLSRMCVCVFKRQKECWCLERQHKWYNNYCFAPQNTECWVKTKASNRLTWTRRTENRITVDLEEGWNLKTSREEEQGGAAQGWDWVCAATVPTACLLVQIPHPLSCYSILGFQMWSLSLRCTIMGSDGC